MLHQIDSVIKKVKAKLPKDFPKDISEPIFEGMQLMGEKLMANHLN